MGCYDCYGDNRNAKTGENFVQLKNGPCILHCYDIGDEVEIADGVYVGYEGVVVIHDKKVLRVDKVLIDKWGGSILPEDILDNPLQKVVDEMVKKYKKEDDGKS